MTTSATVGLIDYGSGNLRSVAKALQAVGAEVRPIGSCPIPTGLRALVLPGVGSFGDSVYQLRKRGLFQPIQEWLMSKQKFLGICLGYQLLFQTSEESPGAAFAAWAGGATRTWFGTYNYAFLSAGALCLVAAGLSLRQRAHETVGA